MDWILLIFLLSIAVFCRPNHGIEKEDDYLSLSNTNALRGIMAIGIVLHHLSEHVTTGKFFLFLNHMGYLLVAVFFFLSGYGLMVQFMKKGKAYLNTIWKKRVLFFTIILLLDTFLYVAFNLLYGKKCTVHGFFLSFVNGHPLAGSSWYLIAQIYFYIFFWCVFHWFECKWLRMFCMAVLIVLCDTVFLACGYPTFWVFSNFAFVLGMLWAQEKSRIDLALKRFYYAVLGGVAALFLLFSFCPAFLSKSAYLPCRMISAPLFAAFVVLLFKKVRIVGRFWSTVNLVSLEIFLLHALVYQFFRSNVVHVHNDVVWTCLTLACTVLLAIPAHLLNQKIRSYL